MSDRITVAGRDGAFSAYVARPKALPAPAVVVLHEVFGVNADIRKTCDELAERGFIAVAPDLFWRQEPGVDLSVNSEPDWQHGLRLYQAYDRDSGVTDIKETLDLVAKLPDCTGKIAVQGYCFGALMTFLTAVRCQVDAAVAYHGADTEKYLDEVGNLHAPPADASGRRGRVHFQSGASPDQESARQQSQCDSLQLSGPAPRLRPA
jgi:carboxymethylenebutenolidase